MFLSICEEMCKARECIKLDSVVTKVQQDMNIKWKMLCYQSEVEGPLLVLKIH